MKGIESKNVIVSAGSSGLGRAICVVLSRYGANVTTFSRNEQKLKATADEVRQKTGKEVNLVRADLASSADLERVIDSAHSRYGGIDSLVVNFGDPRVAPFMEITDKDWDYSIDMMLKSTIHLTKAALNDMLQKKSGRIVYVTSMTTKNPLENFSISAALRSAVIALGKVISLELGSQGINVNSISQGFFMTDRLRNVATQSAKNRGVTYDEALEGIRQSIPMKRFGEPEELGELVAFLCSDASSYLNGTNIQIDGGIIKFPF